MKAPDFHTVCPSRAFEGELKVPGDKSISHRLAMLAALASGRSTLDNFLCSEDCLHTLAAVEALGAGVRREGTRVAIDGAGGRFSAPSGALDMGNSGTGLRLLAGLLAGQDFECELGGDASLSSRPMKRIADPLTAMGADVRLSGPKGTAPVRIRGGGLRAIRYALPVASAQVKSCVLLAGLLARGRTTVIEPLPTRDHTERALAAMGADVEVRGPEISIEGGAGPAALRAGAWRVPGDFSSAAFWLVGAAARQGASVTVRGVGLNPRRTALLDVLRRMGADVDVQPDDAGEWEPAGTLRVRGAALRGTEVAGGEIPNLIDELPLVAAAGALARGRTVIRDAAELRVKESDRIAAMAAVLRAFGVEVDERPDGMVVAGAGEVRGAGGGIESRGDHRIAMCAAVLATAGDGPVRIGGTDCVATSYPGFWNDLHRLAPGAVAKEET